MIVAYRWALRLMLIVSASLPGLALSQTAVKSAMAVSPAESSTVVWFSPARLAQLQQQQQRKNWLLLLWSIDCPPCLKELAIVSKLQQQQRTPLPVILINTDGDETLLSEQAAVLEQLRLTGLTQLYFADSQVAQSRFAIDPRWRGELPRSYFYGADGQRQSHSGLLKEDKIRAYLGLVERHLDPVW